MNKSNKLYIILILSLIMAVLITGCDKGPDVEKKKAQNKPEKSVEKQERINSGRGKNIMERYKPPKGYERVAYPEGSFGDFLRKVPLKPLGSPCKYYDGTIKTNIGIYDGVFEADLRGKDLLQCADACMKYRADYFYHKGEYSKIKFHFVSGETADYINYSRRHGGINESTYADFMDRVYAYSGTLSLPKDTVTVGAKDMESGDIFLNRKGNSGHAVMVMDVVINEKGEKKYMLMQSYMPAQEPQVLLNEDGTGVWYSLEELIEKGEVKTPQWTMGKNDLRRFI